MIKKKALITGANGQDSSYLTEYLLSLNYEVNGIIRRNSVSENQESRIHHLEDKIKTYYGDLTDAGSLEKIMAEVMPDEIYNLGAQSHVRISFDIPSYTAQANAIGTLNMLEAYRKICPKAKFYQASSSEMFGNSVEENHSQNENTKMSPVSPYGCSKLYGYSIVRNYRNSYGLHACNGILFNHESPRRGVEFVTRKISHSVARIKQGLQDKLPLGNLDAKRDWGFAGDYIRAMWMMLQQNTPEEFVIGTGKTYSVREFCEVAFSHVGLNYQDYVIHDKRFDRPAEVDLLIADASKAKEKLGWTPAMNFEDMVKMMVVSDSEILQSSITKEK